MAGLIVGRLTAQLDLDDGNFRRQSSNAESSFQGLTRTAQQAERQYKGVADAAAALEKAEDKLKTKRDAAEKAAGQVRVAEQKLQELRDKGAAGSQILAAEERLADARRRNERATDQAARADRDYRNSLERTERQARQTAASASEVGNAFTEELNGLEGAGEESGDGSGAGFAAGFVGKLKGLGGKGGAIGAALMATVGVGVIVGAKLADAVQQGFAMQGEIDLVQGKLGVDDATMATIGAAAGAAYVRNFGESVAANRDALVAGFDFGLVDTGSSADEMQNLIEKTDTLNSLLNTETADSLRAVSGLVKSGLVANVDEAFDLMVAGRQQGMNAQEDLIDSVSEYSVGWAQTGLSAQTAFALINQSMDLGVDNTDRGADALREFGRRVVEEGDVLTQTFTDLGFNGEEMYRKFVEGGPEAEIAFDQVFDAIRQIEDPAKRAAAAQALLGDTSGDFIKALAQWDPSKAVQDFGAVEGAAQKAGDTIGQGPAAALESARRSITASADEIKLKLAAAFAPSVTDGATWVSENKDEIVLFLAQVASTAVDVTANLLDAGGAAVQFTAMLVEGGIGMIDGFVEPLLLAGEAMAGVIENIPGMGGVANGIQSAVDKTRGLIDGVHASAAAMDRGGSAMFTLADKIRSGSATLDDFILAQQQSIQETDSLEKKTAVLGDTLNLLPRDKAIDITTPGGVATKSLLTELGVKVNTDNNKNIVVESPLAPEVLAVLDQLGIKVRSDNGKNIIVTSNAQGVKVDVDNLKTAIDNVTSVKEIEFRTLLTGEGASTTPPASGTNVMPPLPIAPPKADGGPIRGFGGPKQDNILTPTSNGEWVIQAAAVDYYGDDFMAMVNAGMLGKPRAGGGPVAAVGALKNYMRGIEGAAYSYGDWGNGWVTDCSGGQSIAMNAAAGGNFSPGTGERAGTASFDSYTSGHGLQPGQAPPGIAAYEVGWSPEHAAGTIIDPAGGDVNVEMGGARGDGQYDGPTGSRDSQFNSIAWMALQGDLGPSANIGTGTGSAPTTTTPSTGTTGMTVGAGSAQNVYVVGGHLDSTPSSTSTTSDSAGVEAPEVFGKGPLPLVAYAQGGIDSKPGTAQVLNGQRTWLTMAGEAGAEAYIPLNGSDRSKALWVETGKRLGVMEAFANGGFGGYAADTSDSMKPKNFYDWAALAAGTGFAAASMVTPYVGMATGGSVSLGDLAPTANTSNNTIDGIAQGLQDLANKTEQQTRELREAIEKNGKTLHVVDNGNAGAAAMLMMQKGM